MRLGTVVLPGIALVMTACGATTAASSPSVTPASPSEVIPLGAASPTSAPVTWVAAASHDRVVSFKYPSTWSIEDCTNPPPVGTQGATSEDAVFYLFPDGNGRTITCDYSDGGPGVVPPYVEIGEQFARADTPFYSMCGEQQQSVASVSASNRTSGTVTKFAPEAKPVCPNPVTGSTTSYSGPPLGFLTVYEFEFATVRPETPWVQCIVLDQESPNSPDIRSEIATLVTTTLVPG